MVKLKLVRGRSYTGFGVKVVNTKPIVEVKETVAEQLLATERFQVIGEVKGKTVPFSASEPEEIVEPPAEEPPVGLDEMTVVQLEAYAKELGIDISKQKTKAEKAAKIQEVLGLNNSIDYGENQ